MTSLPFGPLSTKSIMVCIDMQRLFLEPGEWYCSAGLKILPSCEKLAKTGSNRCVFTRFMTATTPQVAIGSWQRYYRHWRSVTRGVIGDDFMNLHITLSPYASPESTFDKTTYDAFGSTRFTQFIKDATPDALVLFGIETDVCVLTTAMSAVDLGYRVIIAVDAVASGVPAAHQACLTHIYPRFDQQIEVATTATIIAAWKQL